MTNEQLRNMLNNLINEKSAEATLDFHQYITEQVKSIVGLSEGAKNIDAFYKIMYDVFDENDHELVSIRSIEIKDGKIIARLEQNDAGTDFLLTLAMTDSGKISVTGKGTGGLKVDFEVAASKAGLNTLLGKLSDMAEKLDESAGTNRHLMNKEVKILSGRYKGKTGYVNKLIGKDEAEIQLDDDGDEFYVNVKLDDIKQLDESAETLNEWYEGDSVFDFVRAVLSGDRDEMEEALRGSSLEKMLKKSGFSSVQEVKSAVKKIRGSKVPAGYEFSYHVNVDGQAVTLISKKKISGINAKVVDIRKLNESVANEPNLLKQIIQYLEAEGFMATYEVRSVRKDKAILGLSEKGADSEAILTLSGNDLEMKLTGINDNEEKQERRFKLKISGKSAKQIGQQLEDEIDSWFHHEMQ